MSYAMRDPINVKCELSELESESSTMLRIKTELNDDDSNVLQ